MANLGKKFLSAFVELNDDKKKEAEKPADLKQIYMPATPQPAATFTPTTASNSYASTGNSKFAAYFEKLFKDANLPGPDYFEFSKMIEAMSSIPDERSRYAAAFAGLSVQGLDKTKLLSTAAEYLRVLNADAANFSSTVDAALQEKVFLKKKEMEE